MSEGLQSVRSRASDEDVERTALAGATAIQQLISDRDHLRNLTNAQQRELVGLRARNDDLRRRLLLVRQSYLELATELLGQFERFDGTLSEALGDQQKGADKPTDATLIDLAQRLAPPHRPSKYDGAGEAR